MADQNNAPHDTNKDVMIVGKVLQLQGQAIAVSPDGHIRDLKVGDPIYLNDTINASREGGGILIKLINGIQFPIHPGSSAILNTETLKHTAATPPSAEETQQVYHGAFHITHQGKLGMVTSGFSTHACGFVNHAITHQEIIGKVQCSEGFVTAQGLNGVTRILNAGDPVYAGDVVTSTLNSTAAIQLASGGLYDLNPDQSQTFSAGACSYYDLSSGSYYGSGADYSMLPIFIVSSPVSSGFDTSAGSGSSPGGGSTPPPPSRAEADLSVTLFNASGNTIIPGTTDAIVIRITNLGPNNITGGTAQASIPTGLFTNVTSLGLPAGVGFTVNLVTGQITFTGVSIAAGQTIDLQLNGLVSPNLREGTSTFNSTGSATDPAGVTDPNTGNNTSTTVNNVQPEAQLTITNVNLTSVVPGTVDTFNINLNNTGPSNLTNVTIIDTLPAGLTNPSSPNLPAGVTFIDLGNGQVEWVGLNIANGQTISLTLQGTVNPSLPEGTNTFINTAQVIVQPGDINTNQANNTVAVANNVAPDADIAVTAHIDGNSSEVVNIGQTVTYTIALSNIGPSDSTNVQVQDILAGIPGITFNLDSATVNGGSLSTAGGNLTWNLSSLGVTGVDQIVTPTLTIVGTVTSVVTTPINNVVTATGDHSSSATSTATAVVNADVGVSTSIVGSSSTTTQSSTGGSSATVAAGDTVTYTITAFNNGGSTATNVQVLDTLPANFSLNNGSITTSIGTFSVNSGVVTWQNFSLAPGASATLTFTETVNAPAAITVNPNTVTISSDQTTTYGDGTTGDNSSLSNVTVIPQASVTITNTDGVTAVIPGTTDSYSITITNNGPSTITNATVADILPTGLTSVTSSSAGFTNLGNGQVEWTGITLASGQSITLNLSGTVDASLQPGTFVNIAQIKLPTGQIDSNSNYTAIDTNAIHPTADLKIQTTDSSGVTDGTFNGSTNATTGGIGIPGTTETYTIVVSNLTGPSDIFGATVIDNLPAGLTGASWTAVLSGGATAASLSGTGNINDLVNLPVGSTITFTINAQIDASSTTTLVNTATIVLPSGATSTDAFNSSTDVVSLQPHGDITITNTDGVNGVTPGTSNTYTITLQNSGPSDITNATVTDTLPVGLVNVTSSGLPAGVSFITLGNGQVEWTGINLPSGGPTVTLQLSGTVSSDVSAGAGTFINTATVSLPLGEVNTGVPTAIDADNVTPISNLTTLKLVDSVSTETANLGQTVTFTVQLTNSGPSDATSVNVNDLLPAGFTFIGATTTAGTSYDANTGVWSIGSLASNTTDTLTLVAQVSTVAASITNTATASAADASGASVLTSSATVNVNADVNLTQTVSVGNSVTNTVASTSVSAGSDVTFQLTATNTGGIAANNTVVTDTLPANFTLVGSPVASVGSVVVNAGVITWTIGTLNPGDTPTLTFTETANAPAVIQNDTNSATITSTETATFGDATLQDNTSVGTVTVVPEASVTIAKTDGNTTVIPGTSDTYSITITNNGPSAITNGTVIDTLPTGFNNVSSSSSGFSILGGGQVEWTGINLASGQSITLNLSGDIDPTLQAGAFTNLAQLILQAGQINSNTNISTINATHTDSINPTADISIQVTDITNNVGGNSGTYNATTNATTGGIAIPGGSSPEVYTIVVSNNSSLSTISNITLSDILPAGISATSAWSITSSTGGATATIMSGTGDILDSLTLPGNSSLTFTLNAVVNDDATGSLINTATLTMPAGVTNTNAFTNSADLVTLQPTGQLDITNINDSLTNTVIPGQTESYTITVTNNITANNAASNLSGITIVDTLPQGFTNPISTGLLPAGVTFINLGNGQVEWTGISLANGDSLQLHLSGTADSGLSASSVSNTVQAIIPTNEVDSNAGAPVSSASSTVAPEVDLSIKLTDGFNVTAGTFNPLTNNTSGGVVTAGATEVYTLVISNTGPSNVTGVSIADMFPSGINVANWSAAVSGGATITNSSGTGNISDTADLPVGSTITFTIDANVSTSATGSLVDTATVTVPVGVSDTNSFTSSTDTQTIQVPVSNGQPNANISIQLTDNLSGTFSSATNDTTGGTAIPGNTGIYTLIVSNSGPTTVTGATVSDLLPAGISNATWTSVLSGGATDSTPSGSGNISDLVNLPSGGSITYTINATFDPAATATQINQAIVVPPATVNDTNQFTQSLDIVSLTPTGTVTLTNSDGVTSVISGSINTYTISLQNSGPSNINNATIIDTLPVGFTNVSVVGSLPAGVTFTDLGNGQVEWTGINLTSGGAGASISLQFSGTINSDVPANNAGGFQNVATVSVPTGESISGTTTATDSDNVSVQANLTTLKLVDSVSTENANLGQVVTFTIQLTNTGPSDATNVSVNDLLPAGLTFIGDTTSAGSYNVGTGDWTIGTLAAGSTDTLTLLARVSSVAASITNTATTTAADATGTSVLTSSASVNVNADVNLTQTVSLGNTVTNTTNAADVNAGSNVTYQLTATNTGGISANNTVVTDTLPANFTLVGSPVASVGSVVVNAGVITWTIGTLNPGDTPTLTFTETANAPSAIQASTNTATITSTQTAAGDATPQDNTSVGTVTVLPTAGVTITNTDGVTTVVPGTTDSYSITVTNNGPSTITNATVIDTLPTGLLSPTSSSSGFSILGGGQVEWTGITLNSGQSITLNLSGNVDSSLQPGSFANIAQLFLNPGQIDSNTAYTAIDTNAILPTADLKILTTDTSGVINGTTNATTNATTGGIGIPGTVETYTIVVSNLIGPSDIIGATVIDNLPAGISSSSWSAVLSGGATAASLSGTGNINELVNLPVGSMITFTINANIAAGSTADLVNSATIVPPAGSTSTDAFNSSPNVVSLQPHGNITLTNSDGVNGVTPGTSNTYTITLQNSGPSDITNATVIDTLPTGFLNAASGTLPAGVSFINLGNGQVEWTGINLASGGPTITLQLSGTVSPDVPAGTGTFTNTATISLPAGEVNTGTPTVSDADNVTPISNLTTLKLVDSVSTEVANFGQVVTFTVQLTNSGPSDATSVNVNDLLPAGFTFLGDTTTAGTSYDPNTGVWSIGTLASGVTDTLTIVAQVALIVPSITNTATASAADASGASVLTSSATVNVNADVNIATTVNVGNSVTVGAINSTTVAAGQNVTYQLTASNTGGNTAHNVVVTETLPANFSLLTGTITPSVGTVSISAGVLTWTGFDLSAGSNATLTYTETTNAPGTIQVNPNTITSITSNETNTYGDATPQNNSAVGDVTVIPQGNIAISVTDGVTTVVSGTTDTYTITITNSGPSAITNATVSDILPAGFLSVSSPSAGFVNLGNGQVEWTGLNIGANQTITLQLLGTVDPNLVPGQFTNIAQISVPTGQIDSASVYTATDTNTITPEGNISIKITDGGNLINGTFSGATNFTTGGIAIPGTSTVYTMVVSNSGPSTITGANITNMMPAGVSSDSWSAVLSGGALITSGGSSGTGNINDIVTLPTGSSITYTIIANISSTATANLVDTAKVTMPSGDTNTNPFSSSTDTILLQPHGNLILTNSDAVSTIAAGSGNTYNVSVTNNGPSAIVGATIIDTLPAGFTNVTSPNLPSGVQFINLGNGQVEWVILNLASAQTLNLQLHGTVSSSLPAENNFTNKAEIFVPSSEVNTNSTTSVTDTNSVTPIADLHVLNLVDGKSAETVTEGSIILYTVQVTNLGASTATGVVVHDPIPAGLTFISDTVTAGSAYNPATGTWSVGNIASGATVTLTIEGQSTASHVSTATVTANNAATVSSTVTLTDPPAGSNTQNTTTTTTTNNNTDTNTNNNTANNTPTNNTNNSDSHNHHHDNNNGLGSTLIDHQHNNDNNNDGNYAHHVDWQDIWNLNNNNIFTNHDNDLLSQHDNKCQSDKDKITLNNTNDHVNNNQNDNSNANCDAHKFDSKINGNDLIDGFHELMGKNIKSNDSVDLKALFNKMGGEDLKACAANNDTNAHHENTKNDKNSNVDTPTVDPKSITQAPGCEIPGASALAGDPSIHPLGPEVHAQQAHQVSAAG